MGDQAWRSAAKAVSWRCTGTADTILVSLLITGSAAAAVSIGVVEVISKMLLYYGHERVWGRVLWGVQPDGSEHHRRSFAKAVSWRCTGTLDTIVISYLITGSLHAAASIGIVEVLTKTLLYYLHERIWGYVRAGRPACAA